MNKIFNLTSTFKSQTVEDGSVMIRGMASTNDFDLTLFQGQIYWYPAL